MWNGEKIKIERGTYTLSSGITSNGTKGIEMYGDGDLTVLRLANSVNRSVVSLTSVKDWHIHDLRIDGNKANQASTSDPAGFSHGILAWESENVLVERTTVHDCRTFGIDFSSSANSKILSNHINNSDANGITIDNEEGGGKIVVDGNVVDGASDVGITAWVGKDVQIIGNHVRNITHNDSPFGLNTHVGLMAEGTPTLGSSNVRFSENIVESCSGYAFACVPGDKATNVNVVVERNTFSNCGSGIYVSRTQDITIKDNVVDVTTETAPHRGFGVRVESDAANVSVAGNTIRDTSSAGIFGESAKVLISDNTISDAAYEGIYDSGGSRWVISSNVVTTAGRDGIRISGDSDNNTIDGNRISGCGGYGINIDNAEADDNVVTSNVLSGNANGALNDLGTRTVKANNSP